MLPAPIIYGLIIFLVIVIIGLLVVLLSYKSHLETVSDEEGSFEKDVSGYKTLYDFCNRITRNLEGLSELNFYSNSLLSSLKKIPEFIIVGSIYTKDNDLYFSAVKPENLPESEYRQLIKSSVEHFSKVTQINVSNLNFLESLQIYERYVSLPDIKSNIKFSLQKVHSVPVLNFVITNSEQKERDFKKISILATENYLNLELSLREFASQNLTFVSNIFDKFKEGILIISNGKELIYANNIARRTLNIVSTPVNTKKIFSKIAGDTSGEVSISLLNNSLISKKMTLSEKIMYFVSYNLGNNLHLISFHDVSEEERTAKLRVDNTNMMVHDLRSPLTVIKDAADILIKRDSQLKKSQKEEMLTDIKGSALSLLNTVNNLLDVSKIESDDFAINKKLEDLSKFVTTKGEHYRGTLEKRAIKYYIKVPKTPIFAKYDPELMERVLNNLVSNANKYTKKGSIKLTLTRVGKQAQISISDTGLGMSAQRKKEIFHKFIKAGTPVNKSFKSTGLGLVIAKSIIEKHGGSISVDSKEGKGSTFTFVIPIADK